MTDATRRWLLDDSVERVDPVCEEDNRLMSPLWPETEPYGTLLLSASTSELEARARAASADFKMEGKAWARRLFRELWWEGR